MPWAAFSLCCQGAEASMPVAETKAPILLQTLGGQAGPGVWCAGRRWGAALGHWLSRVAPRYVPCQVSAQSRTQTAGGGREGIQLGNRKPPTRGYSQASGPPHPTVQSEAPGGCGGLALPHPPHLPFVLALWLSKCQLASPQIRAGFLLCPWR